MQGTEYFTSDVDIEACRKQWLDARNSAILHSSFMYYDGTTKQLCNRLLEPFMWHTVLVTATEFDNFFELRCPVYDFGGPMYKSKKESIADKIKLEGETTKILYDDLFWLNHNKSQAEIHIQKIAEMMWDSYNESKPNPLQPGEWHMPFMGNFDPKKLLELSGQEPEDFELVCRKIATARAARLSYMTFDGEIDYEKDIKLHDQLLKSKHYSPFEHCARAMDSNEYHDVYIKGEIRKTFSGGPEGDTYQIPSITQGWCNNFRGFIPYRYLIENNKK